MGRNFLLTSPPFKVEASVKQLGANLWTARIRRGITIEQVAESIGTGRRAVMDAEKGKPSTGIGVYTALLWKYLLLDEMSNLADPLKDQTGLALVARAERKRGRSCNPLPPEQPCVYFIGDRDQGVVKSNKLTQRLQSLQTNNPKTLQILGVLPLPTEHAAWTKESELHAKFAHLKIQGEWFRLESDLEAEIQNSVRP
jgi:DNA-binding XRE family transcriptional regulator